MNRVTIKIMTHHTFEPILFHGPFCRQLPTSLSCQIQTENISSENLIDQSNFVYLIKNFKL